MPRWFRWTFLGIGIFMIGGSLVYFAYATMRAAAAGDWPAVEGRVVATRIDATQHTDDEGDRYTTYHPVVAYAYQVENRTFRSERLYLNEIETFDYRDDALAFLAEYPTGTPIEVFYNPANPSDSAVVIEGPSWTILVVTVLGLAFFAAGRFIPVERGPRRRLRAGADRPSWLPQRRTPKG